jgi:phosphonate transport system substrate-binding protein
MPLDTPVELSRTQFSRRHLFALSALPIVGGLLAACGDDDAAEVSPDTGGATGTRPDRALRISAIPDQDPEKLDTLYGLMTTYLAGALGIDVEYVPVADYAASVSLFRAGDLDFVWFGGLTGVQARLETDGATVVAQRDIDENFTSVFIANAAAGLSPIADVAGLSALAGRRFTFGSESSTSGRLMPQYFLDQAGVGPDDFAGDPGFSGSHDKTIDLVASGTYEVGALNEQVWRKRLSEQTADPAVVTELFVTPGYHDYHWVLNPAAAGVFGADIADRLLAALVALNPATPEHAMILESYGAGAFIASDASNYGEIEEIGRKLGLITG